MEAKLTEIKKEYAFAFAGVKPNCESEEMNALFYLASEKVFSVALPRVTYKILSKDDSYLNENLLVGKDINRLLKDSTKVVVFAATLGAEVDKALARLQITNLAEATMFDACASAAIENVCDNFCKAVASLYGGATTRFSPGYGDLPFSIQKEIAVLLDMQKNIGVSITESGILIPQKTVTAIFGN